MKTKMKKLLYLSVVGLFAFSLGLAPALVGSTDASAVPTRSPYTPPSIDLQEEGTITIHKFLTDTPSTIKSTGKLGDADKVPADATKLNNVKFIIKKVPLDQDINTFDGFKKAAEMTVDVALTKTKDLPGETVTTVNGEIKVDAIQGTKLTAGVYLIQELSSPKAEPLDDGKTLVPAAPFLVMLPMTDPEFRNSWNYDIHVFPKNQKTGAKKTVTDRVVENPLGTEPNFNNIDDIQAGDVISFDIKSDVPPIAEGKKLEEFIFQDTLEPEKLKAVTKDSPDDPTDDPAKGIKEVFVENPKTVLTKDTDYTVTYTAETQHYEVELTEAGLQKVQDATGGAAGFKVVVTILAEVKPFSGTVKDPGKVTNTATVVTNTGSGEVTTTTDTTETYYGKLIIHKQDKDKTPLAGAKFKLYRCKGSVGNIQLGDAPIDVNGTDEWTTENNGEVAIEGLHVTNFANSKDVTDAKLLFDYCLVETEAPGGFELLPEPVKVTFTKEELFGDAVTTKGVKTVDVENVPSRTPWLPMTGGPGIIILVLAGVTIVIGGTVYGLRSRSKTK